MCAVLLVVARLLRLGFIANFLSRSVLIGFLTGVGIQVAMGQFGGHVRGQRAAAARTLEKFANTLRAIPTETSVPTLVVSLAVLVTILGLERVNKKIPGALIAVVGAIVAELRPRPGRARASPTSARSPAASRRSACRPTSSPRANIAGAAADGHLDGRRDPRPERRHVARLRDASTATASTRTSTSSASAWPTSAPASAARSWSTAARPRPRWSTAPAAGARSRS